MGRSVAVLVTLLALMPGAAVRGLHAQESVPVTPGMVVRLASGEFTGTATVLSEDSGTLRLIVEGLARPVEIDAGSITSLERRRPATTGERVTRGVVWGTAVGAALGLMVSFLGNEVPDEPTAAEMIGTMTVGGAIWGAALGAAIPQVRWERGRLSSTGSPTANGGLIVFTMGIDGYLQRSPRIQP
jgi:hypothetical protein